MFPTAPGAYPRFMTVRVLCVLDRLSLRGGAERYLREVAECTAPAGVEWHALVGHDDGTAGPLQASLQSVRRLKRLDRRVPHAADDETARRLVQAIEEVRPDVLLVQNVMSPALA